MSLVKNGREYNPQKIKIMKNNLKFMLGDLVRSFLLG
jgi:hypothetical protein